MSEAVIDRIKSDQVRARKARDRLITDLLDTVIRDCNARRSIQPMRALTDAEVVSVVRKISLQLDQMNTTDPRRAAQVGRKREQLRRYMPSQALSDDDVTEIALRLHPVMGMKQILDHLRGSYAGRYDPNRATLIVRSVVNA